MGKNASIMKVQYVLLVFSYRHVDVAVVILLSSDGCPCIFVITDVEDVVFSVRICCRCSFRPFCKRLGFSR